MLMKNVFGGIFFLSLVTSGLAGCIIQNTHDASETTSALANMDGILLPPGSHPKAQCGIPGVISYQPSPAEIERDNIYQLATYGVVYKDWQTTTWGANPPARGYNIGSILVDTSKNLGEQIVCWARNSVITTGNGTQHGEVRLMTNYLSNAKVSSLKDRSTHSFKLYSTLEPCSMCGGMMTLQSLHTTLYGQTDPDYGDGIQRLEVDTHPAGGFCPYPRGVYSNASNLPIRQQIDTAYAAWQTQGNRGLTIWLTTPEAKELYQQAISQLSSWQVAYTENQIVKDKALDYLSNTVPTKYTVLPYTVGCTGN
ncbi:MAG: hypothetical protein DRR06_00645 [Gammaproteobacteria bacterium]|nr:MAG: hypothetical protein DRR06_00645 [Gammaproteobacteria bacterium]RLA50807.1 MAG: hypothetical protein DRR42_12055 [Gammaproteobacteria bacterium]